GEWVRPSVRAPAPIGTVPVVPDLDAIRTVILIGASPRVVHRVVVDQTVEWAAIREHRNDHVARNIVQVVIVDPEGAEPSLPDPLSSDVNKPRIASSTGVLEFEPGMPRERLICSGGNAESRTLSTYNCL